VVSAADCGGASPLQNEGGAASGLRNGAVGALTTPGSSVLTVQQVQWQYGY
jgi:hypothetical protein